MNDHTMSIIVLGINHHTAPVSVREKVVFPLEKLSLYLHDLINNENIQEAVILSTCNRSELYCETDHIEKLVDWFSRQHQLSQTELRPVMYIHQDSAAIEHIMRVACGLDSMILGEPQILGQMKTTFSESCAAGSIGPLFNRLFQQVFAVAKEVRSNTTIGACPVSVASAAVNLAKQVFPSLDKATVLVIGAGDTANLVLRYLKSQPVKHILIANRSLEKAQQLAHYGQSISFAELTSALAVADVVITATGSTLPIVTPAMIKRAGKPLYMIDLAVPRDVDPAVGELTSVQLYCIDDLKMIIQQNKLGREHAAEKAQEVIKQKSTEFITWLSSFEAVATTIRAYRKQIEDMCQIEYSKAIRALQKGEDPAQVLASFAHAFTNKLLHTPSVQLRQAGYEGRLDLLQLAQQLFAISQTESELT